MKTPREILFTRHRNAEPKLDAVRRKVLATLPTKAHSLGPGRANKLGPMDMDNQFPRMPAPLLEERGIRRPMGLRKEAWVFQALNKLWLELIWPSRRAWAAMAALWLAVLAANLEMKANSPAVPGSRRAQSRELVEAFKEQRRLLAELLPHSGAPLPAPAPPKTRPRTELSVPFKGC